MAYPTAPSYLDNLLRYHCYSRPVCRRDPVVLSGTPSIVPYPLFLGSGGGTLVVNGGGSDVGAMRLHREYQLQDREEARGRTAAVIGGVGVLALAGTSAYFLKGFSQDRTELKKAREFQQHTFPYLDVHVQQELGPILTKHIEVCENKIMRGRTILVLTGALLACALAAFAGGMFGVPWLITAAIVAGVLVGAAGIFAIVWHWNDETALSPQVLQQVERLRDQIAAG